MTEEIPFGSRALEQGVVVEGIWTSQPSTPVRTDCDNSRSGTLSATNNASEGSLMQPGTTPSSIRHTSTSDLSGRRTIRTSRSRTPVPLRWRSEGSPSVIIRAKDLSSKGSILEERPSIQSMRSSRRESAASKVDMETDRGHQAPETADIVEDVAKKSFLSIYDPNSQTAIRNQSSVCEGHDDSQIFVTAKEWPSTTLPSPENSGKHEPDAESNAR